MRRMPQSKAYMILGAVAAARADLGLPKLKVAAGKSKRQRLDAEMDWLDAVNKAAAEDPAAAPIRDALWLEYERRLRDDKSYSISDVAEWLGEQVAADLASHGVKIGRSSVHRDSQAIHAKERVFRLAHEKATALLDGLEDGAEHDVLKSGRMVAAQLLFDALSNLPAAGLEDMTNPQIINMIEVLGKLSKANAETDLINQKLAEARRRFDEQMKAALAKGKGRLTDEDLAEAREIIFGKVA